MNDRFLFREKRADNGKWIIGGTIIRAENSMVFILPRGSNLSYLKNAILPIPIFVNFLEVYPSTVGQCTGLEDKNGKLIFEGDILKGYRDNKRFHI